MRILLLHTDYIEFEAKEPVKGMAEELKEEEKRKRVEEALVAFVSVEEGDDENEEATISEAVKEILEVAKQVGAKRAVIYPYVHLTSSPAPPEVASRIVKEIYERISEEIEAYRAPFGWYKSFQLKCKGHPLAELSRTIKPRPKTREEVVAEIKSEYFIIKPDGKIEKVNLEEINLDEIDDEALRKYIESEELGRSSGKQPPSLEAMRRLELVDYEPASDSGHPRVYPKGTILFKAIEEWARYIATEELGAMVIITPLIYNWAEPDIRAQAESFHERHYIVLTPERSKKFVLRFAADFGLFRMMKDGIFSYRQLPFRIFEFARSFRYERSGEISGLKRLRGFHMPDLHSFCADVDQGWQEFVELTKKYKELTDATGIEYTVVFRVAKEWWERLKEKIVELVKFLGRPVFVEVLSKMKHYWAIKNEFQAIDSVGGNVQLATVQLDVVDAERYGITYVDKEGKERGTIIVHSSIGSVERWIYAILEEALKKKKPEIPFWLSPIQVRLIPVKSEYVEDCLRIAESLEARVDVDDREMSVAKKIREAEREWINAIIVYGEKERESGKLPVRFRNGELREMTLEELKEYIRREMEGKPKVKMTLPIRVSRRIKFSRRDLYFCLFYFLLPSSGNYTYNYPYSPENS